MPFSNTVTKAGIGSDGLAYEVGTWLGTAVTTGNIVAGAGTNFPANAPKIGKVELFSASSNGATAVIGSQNVAPATLKLTFTSGDAGEYCIKGPSVG